MVNTKPRWVKKIQRELKIKEFESNKIDFSIPQNIDMFEKYRELAEICPSCNLLMSPQAQRCMKCNSMKRTLGVVIPGQVKNIDLIKKMQEKIKELAKEQGVSLKTLGFDEE